MRRIRTARTLPGQTLFLRLRAGLSGVLILIWTCFCAVFGIFTLIVSPSGKAYLSLAKYWAKVALGIAGVKLVKKALFWPKTDERYLYISNHESVFDIIVLYALLPKRVVMVAKHTLFYIPIFGWGMWLAGFVFVKRHNPKQAYKSLKRAVTHLKNSRSVLIFAEGTCDNGKSLLPFKRGAFLIAQICQIPIIPIGISGVHKVLTPDHYLIFPGRVSVCFGRPILPPASEKDIDACKQKTRQTVLSLKKKAQQLLTSQDSLN